MTKNKAKSLARLNIWGIIQLVILVFLVVVCFIPLLMGVLMSFKSTAQIYADFFSLPNPIQWGNYSKAALELIRPLLNTLFIAVISIICGIALASFAAYAFARFRMFGKNFFFMILLSLMMVPGVLTLTPSFILTIQLNLRDSAYGLMLFYIAGSQAFAIFLLRSFFEAQPEELFESARLDGASELKSLIYIALPLARPILVTIAIMNLLSYYNDLIFPMLLLVTPEKHTLMIALQRYAPPEKTVARPDIAVQTAGYMLACVPLLLIFSVGMKYYIQGITSGAIKG